MIVAAKLTFFLFILFLPTLIAFIRQHPMTGRIAFINLIAGWTAVTWLGLMYYSVVAKKTA
jgi:hypothetical protein